MNGPNVLLVVLDTCRRDALEPYGAPSGSTPALADLARRGTAAPHVRAPACWTLPSHASLFTGLLPREAGLVRAPARTPASCRETLRGHRDRLLPEVLRRAGYRADGVSANLWVGPDSGFDTGFDTFASVDSGRQAKLQGASRRERIEWVLEGARARVDDGAAAARRILTERLAQLDDRPFFWFVNLNECHSPYLPPRRYSELGPLQRARAADEARRHLTMLAIWRACAGGFDVPPEALERMRRLYAGEVRLMDDWLGDVLETLDAAGRLDETLVCVISDHGENFGEGGLLAHAFSLDDRLTAVPLVAAGPGADTLADTPALADLPRRLCAIAGIERHPYREHAAGVAQFDPPTGVDDPLTYELVARWGLPEATAVPAITTPMTAAGDARHKLVLRGEEEQWFDLASDPLELAPLGAGDVPQDVVARLRPVVSAATGAARPPALGDAPQQEIDAIAERMKLLGYM